MPASMRCSMKYSNPALRFCTIVPGPLPFFLPPMVVRGACEKGANSTAGSDRAGASGIVRADHTGGRRATMLTEIHRSALLLYPASSLFALVNDIESYPSFMDGCVGADVLHRSEELVEARLHLAKAGIRHSF